MWTLQSVKIDLDVSRSKNDSSYLDVQLKMFQGNHIRDFCGVQNLTRGEAVFNQFMRLRNQLVLAAENFGREETLSPVLVPAMSKDMDN